MTAPLLESDVAGRWWATSEEGTPLPDAVTGETVARIGSRGLDVGAMVTHARTVGGPALRELTFHQRAALLKALGLHLMGRKDEFHALSHRTGATSADNLVDVDGGFGTVLSYASTGRHELPDDVLVLDGPPTPLGKRGTFLGQHVYTSLTGVAVQINAFNFPVWGMLEKLAPAFLAGLPTIVKPASQTAYLTEAVFRAIVETGLLPEGSVQLLSGSASGLLDHLDGQDLVGFTGSASTAALLRSHPAVTERAVRFNAEADSLNCSVLGPDAGPGTPEFDLFVDGVVTVSGLEPGQTATVTVTATKPGRTCSQPRPAVHAHGRSGL